MFFILVACSSNEVEKQPVPSTIENKESSENVDTVKTLVVYYSATGNTEIVANYIVEAIDADKLEIEPIEPYSSDDLDWTNDNSRVVLEHDNPDNRTIELVKNTVDN